MVPSVRAAEKLGARELNPEIRRLTDVARQGKATPTELDSGTFMLNNCGVFGVDGSAAIINHPEVAILGVGRTSDERWVVNGELAVRKVTALTLTFDHRVCFTVAFAGNRGVVRLAFGSSGETRGLGEHQSDEGEQTHARGESVVWLALGFEDGRGF